MSDSFYILVIGIILVGISLTINKLLKIFAFTQKEKESLGDENEETRGQKRVLTLIQLFIIVPVILIVIYIFIKGC